jgi:hypothetical protein
MSLAENPNSFKPKLSLGLFRSSANAQKAAAELQIDNGRLEGCGRGLPPGEPSWTDAKGRAAALNRWCAVIAKEVAKPYETKSGRDAAIEFARGQLSIGHAFHRKLVRKDAVVELTRLFEQSKDVQSINQTDNSDE